jgi:NAD(P)-dependent dehydrogenase (short-subunit alcohol dehydrogenase family)
MSNNQNPVGYRAFDITKTSHKTSYPAISPSKPSLSQAGKTVLITGGSGGIGFAIAHAFGEAGAEKVIIVGRDEVKVGSAAEQLNKQNQGSGTVFEGRACQLADSESIDKLWDNFEAEGVNIDVIVLNAAMTGQFGPIESLGWKKVWQEFEVNVRSYHQFCERLHQNAKSQGGKVSYLTTKPFLRKFIASINANTFRGTLSMFQPRPSTTFRRRHMRQATPSPRTRLLSCSSRSPGNGRHRIFRS